MRHAKPDTNKAEIVAFIRRAGGIWIDMDENAGFDGLLIDRRGQCHIVEIKHPATRNDLTPAERRRQVELEMLECPYEIVTSIEEAAELV